MSDTTLCAIARDGNLPLSFAQQRLWFLHQWTPDSPLYNIPFGQRLTEEVNVAALEKSLAEIIRRHESLRTTFTTIDGQPFQRILDPEPFTLQIIDLQNLPEREREVETQRQIEREAKQPFDLEQGPLFRAKLLRLANRDYFLLITMHHIIADRWSIPVFMRELDALYHTFSVGQSSHLPEPEIQYADFANWQRESQQSGTFESQLAYWKQQLSGDLPVLALPTDHPRPAAQSFRGATQKFVLPISLVRNLEAFSRRENVTLFMTLLASFQVLLHRYTGQEDILVGSPIANRNQTEIEGLIGLFANTLVLRTSLSGDPSFNELLERVHQVVLGGFAHPDVPFELLVETLALKREMSYSPLFQAMFVFDNALLGYQEIDTETAKYDLTLFVREQDDCLTGSVEYNTDLFERAAISRLIGHWQTLLESIVANPNQRLTDLKMLTEPERHQVLVEWNDTTTDYSWDKCFNQLFEEQVERTPEAIAVVFENQRLTYCELNRQANQVAHYLKQFRVGAEVLVGILMDRSQKLLVALLGILKAGGAYVPLDPSYPKARLEFMIEDAQVSTLITEEKFAAEFQKYSQKLVCLDRDWAQINEESGQNLNIAVRGENLAYVIYTSGSTGRPKGVMVEHRQVVNLAEAVKKAVYAPQGAQQWRATISASLSFDASVEQIVLLLSGHTVHILSEEIRRDSELLFSYIQKNRLDVMNITPSQVDQLISVGMLRPGPHRLKAVLVGGEAIGKPLWEILAQDKETVFFNVYGPTECTVDSIVCRITDGVDRPVIGRPIANTRIYILDQHQQLVPAGVPGELFIGGTGVARGYLNRAELTREKFLADPFCSEDGARMYRTGDLARYLDDGTIEFLGRVDDQVKIRGFRIELGEIEAVLRQHPTVKEAVVVVQEERGNKRLVAYVLRAGEITPGTEELRRFLQEKLPEYMVPGAFKVMAQFPLTANGKIDRKVLAANIVTSQDREHAFVAPQTPTEESLAKIWGEVLHLERVGVHDNFFESGGHSLLATQVLSRVRNEFKIEMSLHIFFEALTVAEQANYIETIRWIGQKDRANSDLDNRKMGEL